MAFRLRGKCGKEIPPGEKGKKKASPWLCLCQALRGLFLTQPGVPQWQSQELQTHRDFCKNKLNLMMLLRCSCEEKRHEDNMCCIKIFTVFSCCHSLKFDFACLFDIAEENQFAFACQPSGFCPVAADAKCPPANPG